MAGPGITFDNLCYDLQFRVVKPCAHRIKDFSTRETSARSRLTGAHASAFHCRSSSQISRARLQGTPIRLIEDAEEDRAERLRPAATARQLHDVINGAVIYCICFGTRVSQPSIPTFGRQAEIHVMHDGGVLDMTQSPRAGRRNNRHAALHRLCP